MQGLRPWLLLSLLAALHSEGNAVQMKVVRARFESTTNVTDSPTITPSPTITAPPTTSPTNSTTSPAPTPANTSSVVPTTSPAPTPSNATASPAPSSPPTRHSPLPTTSPAPTTSSPTTVKPTHAPTIKPTHAPTAAPTKPQHHNHEHPSLLRILGKTIAWLFIIALALLLFGFIMSNRYRIYYYVRSAWFRFLRWEGTQWFLRKSGLGRLLGLHPNESSSFLNQIIFDNDLDEGLLLQST